MEIEQIRDLVFLDLRAKIGHALFEQGLLTINEGNLGWWEHDTWISFYDVLEHLND